MQKNIESVKFPGAEVYSPAKILGEYLKEEAQKNPNFYFFSPDETTSNKLDAIYKSTSRAWANLPIKSWDLPESADGRIIELLSENTLFAVMQGLLLSNRPAMMTSYEAFFQIISAQIIQHLKFIEQSERVSWQRPHPATNLLSTSTCWRQDHNGFSHQSPSLISTLLSRPGNHVNCIFPVDDVAMREAFQYMMNSHNVVNLTTFNKTDEPRWIDNAHAKFQYQNGGASIFGFASDDTPDFIFTAAGDIITRESLYAIRILKNDLPGVKLRFVGINSLTYNTIGTTDRKLSQEIFNEYFGHHQPIIANFHGYPDNLKNILSNYTNPARIYAHGFIEQGSTTTPFEMLTRNHASRYDLCIQVAKLVGNHELVQKYQAKIQENIKHAEGFGIDLPEITEFRF